MRCSNSHRLTVYAEPPVDVLPSGFSYLATCKSLCAAFSRATGSTLAFSPTDSLQSSAIPSPVDDGRALWSATVGSPPQAVSLHLLRQGNPSSPSQPEAVVDLAQQLGDLLDRYFKAGQTAEKISCNLGLQPSRKQTENLQQCLQNVLQTMVEALDCTAAGMYVLDDATSILKLRAMWGLPIESLASGPRDLENAKADLEAMLGHAVVLPNKQMFELWQVPEMNFEAAVCVPLSIPTTVMGTVWLYHTEQRSFSDPEVKLLEVLTGRLAMELESAAWKIAEPIPG